MTEREICELFGVDNPEQFADFPLGHGGCAYIARQGDIALPVHRDNVPNNGSCNKILKDIGRQCGFKVRLTYHVARHTNATTVLLSHGVPIETVSRLLGHTNIKTTQIYAKITAQKISQDMETLSHKLEDMEKNICRAI
jgi:integrase